MDKEIERCNVCVLPKSPYFDFDNNGTCSLCRAAKQITNTVSLDKGGFREELDEYIQRMKKRGQGQSFDCVVGISGGRDSSYLLYLLTHKHHLRCLAAYYRTPFTSSVTDANARRVANKLNVPLVEIDISKELHKLHKRIAREFAILWAEKPHPVITNMACAPCKLINREIFKIARANGIKAVVYGGNKFEAVQIASGIPRNATLTTNVTAAKQLALVVQLQQSLLLIKRGIEALKISNNLWRYVPLGFKSSLMYISPHTPYLRFRYPGILALEYFFYYEWEETECEKVLIELGWELPPGCKSAWKSDCSFAELKNYMFQKMMGVNYMDAFMINKVRAGKLNREEALRRIKIEGMISAERLSEVVEILELPKSLSALFMQ
jgi:hypothetical protein